MTLIHCIPIAGKTEWINGSIMVRDKIIYNVYSPRTWSVFPPMGNVSNASGNGVLDAARNTEWLRKLKPLSANNGSKESLQKDEKSIYFELQKIRMMIMMKINDDNDDDNDDD